MPMLVFIARAPAAIALIALAALAAACVEPPAPAASTPLAVATALPAPTPSPTATATNTPTPTLTPTATSTATPTPTATATATFTATPTPTATNTPTPTFTATPTPTATNTPTPTATFTATPTPTPTFTATPTPTATNTPTPTPTPTATPVPPRAALASFGGSDWLIENKPELADAIGALGWVADGWVEYGVDNYERGALGDMIQLSTDYETVAWALLDMAWVADGVSDSEVWFITSLRLTAESSQTAAERVLALPWTTDGVSDSEALFISGLAHIAKWSATVAERVLALTWVADGLSDTEASAAANLSYIARSNADVALQVVDMPFLQTLEAADAAALESLGDMDSDQLADMLSRPMLKDGITDDEAPIVSMLRGTLKYAPDVANKLLDPDATTVERRTVDLPLAGEVDLVIVRTLPGARRSMDLLENAVRESEKLMGEPFPKGYVGLLYENATSDWDATSSGTNFWTHIAIRPEYESNTHLLAHEVAHYYSRGSPLWISEGMAELMASAIENRRVGTPIDFTNYPCESARSIKELEALAPEKGEDAFRCHYSLGERLFVSLLRTLGEDAFWERARSLYTVSIQRGAGIEEVRQAFGAKASAVIARWYEGG